MQRETLVLDCINTNLLVTIVSPSRGIHPRDRR